jgi:hypothetical protein
LEAVAAERVVPGTAGGGEGGQQRCSEETAGWSGH